MQKSVSKEPFKLATLAIFGAAVLAVILWSLKPVFISVIGDRGDYAEVYVVAAAFSVAVSAAGAVFTRKNIRALAAQRPAWTSFLIHATISGVFLALWYYGFYRALYGAPKVDATIIAFTWPLIAAIVMPLLSPGTAKRLKPYQWFLVLLSFAGAAAIGASGLDNEGSSKEIIWAFVAAVGSGLYLPFAINSVKAQASTVKSSVRATFLTFSVANLVALVVVLIALPITGQSLDFSGFDAQVYAVCALIGIGTYLVAEIAWTWAFKEHSSLTLASLPYFSPAVSVLLLFVFFSEPVTSIALIGLSLVLISNLVLHLAPKWSKQNRAYSNSP